MCVCFSSNKCQISSNTIFYFVGTFRHSFPTESRFFFLVILEMRRSCQHCLRLASVMVISNYSILPTLYCSMLYTFLMLAGVWKSFESAFITQWHGTVKCRIWSRQKHKQNRKESELQFALTDEQILLRSLCSIFTESTTGIGHEGKLLKPITAWNFVVAHTLFYRNTL